MSLLFENPPLTGRPGRPRATHCKRGHERKPEEKSCVACRRYRERYKYSSNAEFRQKKRDDARQWRKDFMLAFGYGPWKVWQGRVP